jgi:hypothetical protein
MQNLKFNYDQKIDLEETLILVPLGGVYMFGFFSIVASAFSEHESNGLLVLYWVCFCSLDLENVNSPQGNITHHNKYNEFPPWFDSFLLPP